MRFVRLALVCALVAGCGLGGIGSATVDGKLGDWTIKVQTAYTLVDATENQTSIEDGRRVYKARDKKILYLVLDGGAWDPNKDQRFVTSDEKEQIAYERAINGGMLVGLLDADKLAAGQTYIYDSTEPPTGEGARIVESEIAFGYIETKPSDTLPVIPRYGSKTIIRVQFDQVPTKAGEAATGKLELIVSKTNDDPTDALEGTLSFQFSAPLVPEFIGECSGGTTNCEPDRPFR